MERTTRNLHPKKKRDVNHRQHQTPQRVALPQRNTNRINRAQQITNTDVRRNPIQTPNQDQHHSPRPKQRRKIHSTQQRLHRVRRLRQGIANIVVNCMLVIKI